MVGRRVWLVRHGYREDYVNPQWTQTASFPHDPPLSKEGLQQAQDLVAAFSKQQPVHVFVSPYLRTLQTGQPLAQAYSIKLNVEPGIGEIHPAGKCILTLSADERKRLIPQINQTYRSSFVPAEAETSQITMRRVATVIDDILQHFPGDLLFITHETPIRGIASHLMNGAHSIRCSFCGITELQQQDSVWRLICNGDVSHLSAPISQRRFVWDYIRRQLLPRTKTHIQTS